MVTNRSNGLAVVAQALVFLAEAPRGMATSTEIGDHLDLNPVVIRRLLGVLRSEGIVESRSGPKGGWAVARDLRPSRWEGSTASSRAIPKLLLRPRWTRRW